MQYQINWEKIGRGLKAEHRSLTILKRVSDFKSLDAEFAYHFGINSFSTDGKSEVFCKQSSCLTLNYYVLPFSYQLSPNLLTHKQSSPIWNIKQSSLWNSALK